MIILTSADMLENVSVHKTEISWDIYSWKKTQYTQKKMIDVDVFISKDSCILS